MIVVLLAFQAFWQPHATNKKPYPIAWMSQILREYSASDMLCRITYA